MPPLICKYAKKQTIILLSSINSNPTIQLPVYSMFVLILLSAATFTIDALVRRPNGAGLMKLCPPGGESFTAAWEITCGMRRKKRIVQHSNDVNDALFKGIDQTPLNNAKIVDLAKFEEIERVKRSPIMIMENDSREYRAPSMTEMMLLCCRYGCSLRDLMPYCDPFGQWDS